MDYHDPLYTDDADNPQGFAYVAPVPPSYHDAVYDPAPGFPQGVANNDGPPVVMTIAGSAKPFPWTAVLFAAFVAFVLADD